MKDAFDNDYSPYASFVATDPAHRLHITLWIGQVFLALLFVGAGSAKVVTPLPELAKSLPYTADLPGWLVRFIGISEIAGAVGLILPAISRVVPMLVAWAACGTRRGDGARDAVSSATE